MADKAPAAVPFDFRAPRLSALQPAGRELARRLSAAWSSSLPGGIGIRLEGILKGSYREFAPDPARSPGCRQVEMSPLTAPLLIDIAPSLLFPMLNRLMGGSAQSGPVKEPPAPGQSSPAPRMTGIEQRVLDRMVSAAAQQAAAVWSGRSGRPLIAGTSGPIAPGAVPEKEPWALVFTFQGKLGDRTGAIRFCAPAAALDAPPSSLSEGASPSKGPRLDDVPLELALLVPEPILPAGGPASLKPGDLLETGTPPGSPLVVTVQGVPQYWAKACRSGTQRAVRIVRVLP